MREYDVEVVFVGGVMCLCVGWGRLQAACFGPPFSQCIEAPLATDARLRSRDATQHH